MDSRNRRRRESWQRPSPCAEQELDGECEEGNSKRPAEELREAHVRFRLHGLSLELIDLLVNALQRRGVSGPEVPAAGRVRDVGEQRFIDAHRPVLVPEAEESTADGNG